MADSPASTLTLAEEGGTTLHLRDRALPYRPISITGTQRAEFTWYPGSPQATVQMLGPEEGVITLNGFWKDRFIQGTDAVTIGDIDTEEYGLLRQALGELGGAVTAASLVNIVDGMRRNGRMVVFTWEGLTRYCHITSFTQTWHNVHDCEWSLDLSVISQEALNIAAMSQETPTPADAAAATAAQAKTAEELAGNPPAALVGAPAAAAPIEIRPTPLRPPTWGAAIQSAIMNNELVKGLADSLNAAANGYADIATNVTSVVELPGNMIRDTIGFADELVGRFARSTTNAVDSAITEVFAVGTALGLLSQDQVPFGIQLGAKSYMNSVNNTVNVARNFNAAIRYIYTSQLQGDVESVFVAPANMDLRDVSTKFYNTPDNWWMLMLYNELPDSRLRAGQEIKIPRNPQNGVAGSTGGGAPQ